MRSLLHSLRICRKNKIMVQNKLFKKTTLKNKQARRLMAKEPKDVSHKASDKEDMKDENSDNIIEVANEANKTIDGTGNYKQLGIFKQVLGNLVKGLKNPRKLMNMVLVVFLVVLLALFVRNGIRSLGNYYN
ncbi:hypothetical protein CRYUN_Cryun11dG0098900 [Craigia yunnanensis]